jgi:uncharacterized protein YodC (DUF2158 family)
MTRTADTLRPPRSTYQPGDIVELVVGSPAMVVLDVCADCGEVETAYTDSDGDVVFNTFPAVVLELAE